MTLYIEQYQSPHFEGRKNGAIPRFLILHYSGCPEKWMHDCFMGTSFDERAASRVSAHYLVLENGHINQYVHENMRAWHAGKSYWDGESDLNSTSIGVEMVNMGADDGYPPFTEAQITAAIKLCQDILHRHPAITPFNVLGHSDIAPDRKLDPGPSMPWARFADAGVGIMPPNITEYLAKNDIDRALTAIGYDPNLDLETRMRAFCVHYAPEGLGTDGFAAAHAKLAQLAAMKAEFENHNKKVL